MSDYSIAADWALEQDARDPLAWARTRFALPADESGSTLGYFAGNSLGLMPLSAPARVEEVLEDWGRMGVAGHLEGRTPWLSYHETVREPLARLAGAFPHEVVAMNSLTVNLHLLLVSLFRPAGRRTRILLEETAFPSDGYAVRSHLAARGLPEDAVIVAAPEEMEAILAQQGDQIALVWVSAVHYFTGMVPEVRSLTRAAHAAGALIGLDLAHAIGNIELELHDWDVDCAVWCSYKYLNSGPGAVGGCYLHERHASDRTLPRFAGWWGNDPATRFEMQTHPDFVAVETADGWQLSNPPILSFAPLCASLDIFGRAGMPELRRKSVRLTGYLEFLLAQLPDGRIEIVTSSDPERRGCQLSIRVLGGQGPRLVERLGARGLVTDFRDPDVVRIAPVPLYNTFGEVHRLGQALRESL